MHLLAFLDRVFNLQFMPCKEAEMEVEQIQSLCRYQQMTPVSVESEPSHLLLLPTIDDPGMWSICVKVGITCTYDLHNLNHCQQGHELYAVTLVSRHLETHPSSEVYSILCHPMFES
jgi:hypothetical protein